jgi:hypothetical protein
VWPRPPTVKVERRGHELETHNKVARLGPRESVPKRHDALGKVSNRCDRLPVGIEIKVDARARLQRDLANGNNSRTSLVYLRVLQVKSDEDDCVNQITTESYGHRVCSHVIEEGMVKVNTLRGERQMFVGSTWRLKQSSLLRDWAALAKAWDDIVEV